MGPSATKRHHYIPRMLLRNFYNGSGTLWIGDRQQGSTYETSAVNAFVRKRFYTRYLYPRGTSAGSDIKFEQSDEYEIALARIESAAAPALRRIIESARRRECPELPLRMRDSWKHFYLAMARRTPESQERVKADERPFPDIFYEAAARKADEDGFDLPDQASLYADPRVVYLMRRVENNVNARFAAGTSSRERDEDERFCREHGLAIAAITFSLRKDSFVIGSHGLAMVSGPRHIRGSWLPIARDVAIAAGTQPQRESLMLLDRSQEHLVTCINDSSARHSQIIAGPRRKFIRRVMRRVW